MQEQKNERTMNDTFIRQYQQWRDQCRKKYQHNFENEMDTEAQEKYIEKLKATIRKKKGVAPSYQMSILEQTLKFNQDILKQMKKK